MLSFIIALIKIIVIIGLLVTIHEGGHFLVAKLCKIRVKEFAIGYGPTIWKKQGKETKYALRLIPLGGFVDLDDEDRTAKDKNSYRNASIPKRIAVISAGGLVNIFFALIVYFALMSFTGNNVSNIVDRVIPETGAEVSKIQSGDKIIKVNGKTILYNKDLQDIMDNLNGDSLQVTIERDGEQKVLEVEPMKEEYNYTGIAISSNMDEATKIMALTPKSPGAVQGLQANDIIVSVNGVDVKNDSTKLVEEINKNIGEKIVFNVERNGKTQEIEITPEVKANYYMGVYLKLAEKNFANNVYYAFFETKDFAASIIDNLKLLFTGNVSIDQMMGPVGIGGVVAETTGFADFIYILALVSLSLGFTNLLPFPPLDGGKILLLLIEAIRRKPLSEKTEITIQSLGAMAIIGLSVFITYNDILRVF